jgi:DNA-binding GntR family transcriptional regulator
MASSEGLHAEGIERQEMPKTRLELPEASRRLSPVKEGRLYERVYRSIIDAIYGGRFRPGEPLRELQLAAELQVSQATVREALLRLERAGLVVRTPHKGTHVTNLSPQQLCERLELRCLLEGVAAVEASKHMTGEDFVELRRLERSFAQALGAGAFYEVCQADFQFHRLIWQRSHNETLRQILELLSAPTFAFMSVLHTRRSTKELVVPHKAITRALRRGDPDVIKATIESHIRRKCQ